jgi:hypothetical protein
MMDGFTMTYRDILLEFFAKRKNPTGNGDLGGTPWPRAGSRWPPGGSRGHLGTITMESLGRRGVALAAIPTRKFCDQNVHPCVLH